MLKLKITLIPFLIEIDIHHPHEITKDRPTFNLLCSKFSNPKALYSYKSFIIIFLIAEVFQMCLENCLTFSIPPFSNW